MIIKTQSASYGFFDPQIAADGRQFQHEYISAKPYPHIVLDNFLDEDTLELCLRDFPDFSARKTKYAGRQENLKFEFSPESLSPPLRSLFHSFNSSGFVEFLENLTGINGLIPDPYFLGGGLHEVAHGGHLNIHADFNDHPVLKKKRCLNALIYFNKEWKPEYRGALELWDRGMRQCVRSIHPDFNRCVIFATGTTSFHGHPEPLACPDEVARQSLALYYYTDWLDSDEAPRLVTTDYRLRPNDYARKLRAGARRVLGQRLSERIGSLLPRGTDGD